jgi:hypothetical protein
MKFNQDFFTFRDGEHFHLYTVRQPDSDQPPLNYAVQLRTLNPPPGPRRTKRDCDGVEIVNAAVVACRWVERHDEQGSGWQWMQMSPLAKEQVGDVLIDSECPYDIWYYMKVI